MTGQLRDARHAELGAGEQLLGMLRHPQRKQVALDVMPWCCLNSSEKSASEPRQPSHLPPSSAARCSAGGCNRALRVDLDSDVPARGVRQQRSDRRRSFDRPRIDRSTRSPIRPSDRVFHAKRARPSDRVLLLCKSASATRSTAICSSARAGSRRCPDKAETASMYRSNIAGRRPACSCAARARSSRRLQKGGTRRARRGLRHSTRRLPWVNANSAAPSATW